MVKEASFQLINIAISKHQEAKAFQVRDGYNMKSRREIVGEPLQIACIEIAILNKTMKYFREI